MDAISGMELCGSCTAPGADRQPGPRAPCEPVVHRSSQRRAPGLAIQVTDALSALLGPGAGPRRFAKGPFGGGAPLLVAVLWRPASNCALPGQDRLRRQAAACVARPPARRSSSKAPRCALRSVLEISPRGGQRKKAGWMPCRSGPLGYSLSPYGGPHPREGRDGRLVRTWPSDFSPSAAHGRSPAPLSQFDLAPLWPRVHSPLAPRIGPIACWCNPPTAITPLQAGSPALGMDTCATSGEASALQPPSVGPRSIRSRPAHPRPWPPLHRPHLRAPNLHQPHRASRHPTRPV
jgi:hypothetical protein